MLYLSEVLERPDGSWKLKKSFIPKKLTDSRIGVPDDNGDISFSCNEGAFKLSGVSNNCGMVYLSGMYFNGTLTSCKPLIAFGMSLADAMGYTKVFYTLTQQQEELEKDLLELGWKEVEEMGFTNKRTGNFIKLLTYTIEGE
jgi:hypothetical protein